MSAPIAQRRISEESHQQFAALSGDLNPLHVDVEAAKQMLPGQRLAYGMDMLLWALEALANLGALPRNLARVRVRFTKWVFLGDLVSLSRCIDTSEKTYELLVDDATVAVFDLYVGDRVASTTVACTQPAVARRNQPKRLLLHELLGREDIVLSVDEAACERSYPLLSALFGAQFVSECATCSYIIGMEAPGLYSMSMKYDLQLCATPGGTGCVHYKVVATDERFRKIRVAVNGAAVTAILEAMVREA